MKVASYYKEEYNNVVSCTKNTVVSNARKAERPVDKHEGIWSGHETRKNKGWIPVDVLVAEKGWR
jgi:hypothetical protein